MAVHRPPDIKTLGLPEVLRRVAAAPHGLALFAGPPESGRSTTMSAVLVESLPTAGPGGVAIVAECLPYNFPPEVRHITLDELRDGTPPPAVLMLDDELCDAGTADLALQLAAGTLVLACVAGHNTIDLLTQFPGLWPDDEASVVRDRLAGVVLGAVTQQLLPRVRDGAMVLAMEVMMVSNPGLRDQLRDNISDSRFLKNLIETSAKEGMFSMNASLLRMYREGIIARETAVDASPDRRQLLRYLEAFTAVFTPPDRSKRPSHADWPKPQLRIIRDDDDADEEPEA
ncbi:MAG: hypothetical protein AB7K09_02120 [Planctomycetota bacterium]